MFRMIFTQEQVPYADRHRYFRPINLDFALPLWRSTELVGWWLSAERWHRRNRGYIWTLAARRTDAAKEPGGEESGETNWDLTQGFGSYQAPFAARHAVTALLAVYANRLAVLRDRAGIKRRLRRPVRDGRDLDDYLIRDGLDAATVTSDLDSFTQDLNSFRWGVPEFIEHRDHLPESKVKGAPVDYVPALCASIRRQASRLAVDAGITIENIKASAELRQAVANTRLQRFVLALSVLAAVIAIVSLLVAIH